MTILAGADATIRSRRRVVRRNGPRWLMPKVASKPSFVSVRSERMSPALLTSTSIRSQRSSRSAAPRRTESRSARSKSTSSTSSDPVERRMSATASRPDVSLRAVSTVRAPAPASASAVALPIPEFAPVTTTVFPAIDGTSTAAMRIHLHRWSVGPTLERPTRPYCGVPRGALSSAPRVWSGAEQAVQVRG